MGVRLMVDEAGQELDFSFTSAAEVYRKSGTWTGTRIMEFFTHIYPVDDLSVVYASIVFHIWNIRSSIPVHSILYSL